ncbi:MAG: response regulator [Lachnospiraceae bacterium]|nr:response regulator [Lachnospiraceae bacterium]
MKELWKRVAEGWKKLGKSVYLGERLEHNLKLEVIIGLIIMLTGGVMTCVNTVQKKGFVTWTTAFIFLAGLLIIIFAGVLKQRTTAILIALFMCLFIFTWYAVNGVNEGFAILWIMLVPLAFSYFGDVRFGVLLSAYYEILIIILFYTPIRARMEGFYTKTFMDRFPVLYLCGTLLNSIAMIQYHLSIIAQMEYEEKLKAAIEEAKNANEAKSEFLAQMSHEIRTPINAVLGMNEMILRESKDESILEYADSIDSAGNTLLSLINSILDFSKIEDGKMDIIPVKYDTAAFLNNLYQSVVQRAEAKGLIFIMDADETLPCTLFGDDVRVSQVIMNLLTNAVKYTEKGRVRLSVNVKDRDQKSVRIRVCVEDTGIGIKEEDKSRLFESFKRLDEIRNHSIEGTGLGISIVTNLLTMMGSMLEVESTYGKGSKFSFTIRQEIADPAPIGNYEQRLKEGGRRRKQDDVISSPDAKILVVDDNEMNLKVVRNLLKLNGIVPDLVNSGTETIERMKQKTYDIVFLDHMMPGMDGIETLHKLKEMNLVPSQTVIIALTANAVVGARENYLKEGFTDYLSKPIELGQLVEKLKAYLPKGLYQVQTAQGHPELIQTQKLQMAPQETKYERLDAGMLDKEQAHYVQFGAASPEGILINTTEPAFSFSGGIRTDEILSDAATHGDVRKENAHSDFAGNAQEQNETVQTERGTTILSAINSDEKPNEAVPSGEKEINAIRSEKQANDVIPSVEKATGNAEMEIMEFAPVEDNTDLFASDSASDYDIEKLYREGVDTAQALRYCANDESMYFEILSDFEKECADKMDEICSLYEKKDWKEYCVKVHALKSNAKMMGLTDLFDQALALEEASRVEKTDFIMENHDALIACAKSKVEMIRECRK